MPISFDKVWKQPIPTNLDDFFKEDYICNLLYRELIYRACNKDRFFTDRRGKTTWLKRGQVVFGRNTFAQRLGGHDDMKIERALRKLEKVYKLLSKQSNQNFSIVELFNYDEIVELEQANEQAVSKQRASSEQAVSTSKSVESVKTDKNEKEISAEDREIDISQNPVKDSLKEFNKKLITSLSVKSVINSKFVAVEQEKCSYGNKEINEFLVWYKDVCKNLGVTFENFYCSGANNERNFAKHFLNYKAKHQYDNKSLEDRLIGVFNDKWILGKASNLKIVYNALKSLPEISEKAKPNKLVYITL